MPARKPKPRYRFKDGKSRFNDVPLDGLVLVQHKAGLYKPEDPKELRARGLPKGLTFTYTDDHSRIFLEPLP